MNHPNASLIVRLPNWVGDAVMALPALKALEGAGVSLLLIGKPWAKDLLFTTGMPVFSLTPHFWQARRVIASLKSNHVLLLTNSFSSALMARLAGKAVIGYNTDGRGLLLRTSIHKPSAKHEVDYFFEIAGFACRYWFPESQWVATIPSPIRLPLNPLSIASAKQASQAANVKNPYIVLCPFAHGMGRDGQSKIWPYWRELTHSLRKEQLVVCPGINEAHLCSELVPQATVLPGLQLSEYAAILAEADFVIANDSGPMHLASSVNANTLGIFGVSDPVRTSPWGGYFIGELGKWPNLAEVMDRIGALFGNSCSQNPVY